MIPFTFSTVLEDLAMSPSLNQLLKQLGYITAPSAFQYKKNIVSVATGQTVLLDADADEVWKWLKETEQV